MGGHPKDLLDELNDFDNQIVRLFSEMEEKMHSLLVQMVERVVEQSEVVDDKLIVSELILSPSDLNLAEAASLFQGEGIFPG